ncbi:hypothetical protein [Ammoniphilus sp. CFH 90114]|nr:hypothetical protein [Ammoniphilus sp. CFH 90114]
MSANALLIAFVSGVLTYIIAGEMHPLLITNVLLGLIAGKMTD